MKIKRKTWKAENMDESFLHALRGIARVFNTQRNFRTIILMDLFTIMLGIYLKVGAQNLVILFICSGMLLVSEVFNSIVEEFGNFASPEFHPIIKKIKNISAAAVLMAGCIFLIVNFIIIVIPVLKLWS